MPPMNWAPVREYFRREILSRLDPAGTEWFSRLVKSPSGDVLASCIVIDIASGALKIDTLLRVLSRVDSSIRDARMAFHSALFNDSSYRDLICSSCLHSPPLEEGDSYTRVMSLRVFIDNYVVPQYPVFSSLVKADREAIKRLFFSSGAFRLGSIRRWWTGSHPLVWVTSLNTLLDLLAGQPEDQVATFLNDHLGLGYPDGEELVWVRYPQNFDAFVGVTQPTTLDASWKAPSGFYLSYPKGSGWGKTQSCSGTMPGAPERVHSHFKNLTHSYVAEIKGSTKTVRLSRAKLIGEANDRVRMALA